MKKIGITLIAGLALTVTGPAISAQAGPTRWTVVHAEATASFYACRIPVSNGTTIKAYLDGDLVGVGAGIAVLNSAVVAEVALDGAAPAGEVFVPAATGYSLLAWMGSGGDIVGGSVTKSLAVTELARC